MPIAELSADAGRIDVYSEYRDRELIKLIPGKVWDDTARVWFFPVSWAACVQLRAVFGGELQIGERLNAWAAAEVANRIQPCMELRAASDAPEIAIFNVLFPYQRAGVRFLATARQALCADEMGLGKTIQTIAAMEVVGGEAYPALVVCPNSMKLTWAAEFSRWAPGRRIVVAADGAAKRRKAVEAVAAGEADVIIMNYDVLAKHSKLAKFGNHATTDAQKEAKDLNAVPLRSVIADEAHRAKDPTTAWTRALWALGDQADVMRIALTGTPIANNPVDAWAIMRFVSPSEFPAKTAFVDRYALATWNMFGGKDIVGLKPEAQDELFKIVDPRFIRRLKKAVLPELPEKMYATRVVEMGTAQKKAYEQMRKEMLVQLDSGVLLATSPLVKMTRLIQFASAHGDLVPNGMTDDVTGDPLFDLRLSEPSCKVDAALEIAEELGDAQCVIFSESAQLAELTAAKLIKSGHSVGRITGAVAPVDRQTNVVAFQEGRLKILVVTLGAGGEGLTLTAASVGVFLQRSASGIKNAQAEDRLHRIGQTSSVSIIDVITENTVESRIRDIIATKADQLEQFCRDEATLKEWLAK